MGKPAARLLDMTAHGGMVAGPGCPTVLIGKMPSARFTDMHVCPMCTGPVPHVGGPIIGPVPPTVFIGKLPAACAGDMCTCVGPPSTILPPGCMTVLIGQAGGGGGGGGGGSAASAGAASPNTGSAPSTIQGTETFPIDIQRTVAQAAQYQTPEETKLLVELIGKSLEARGSGGEAEEEKETVKLTIADFVDILKKIESEESYEAARFFASYLDYSVLTGMAERFTKGEDTDANNDPNLMPTRFMILYGADDAKLKEIDDHPDCFDGEEHKINVANLRKGLKLLGHDIKDDGPYDDEVRVAHAMYLSSVPAPVGLEEYNEMQELESFLGKDIKNICGNEFTSADVNHCAHFVGHAKNISLGYTCRNQTGKGPAPGASIRVNEIFNKCTKVGKWSEKPGDLKSCLAFVTLSSNVKLAEKQMSDHPKKHIGMFCEGMIYHYSNTRDTVVKQTPEQFAKHYTDSNVEMYYGIYP